MSISAYVRRVAGPAATFDAFNVVAEPRRRAIFALVAALGVGQAPVCEHLRAQRRVRSLDPPVVVEVRGEGRLRIYRFSSRPLRPVHGRVGGV